MTRTFQEARNILCVRLDALGDVLMTTPAFKAIKAGDAQRRITLLTSSSGAAIAKLVPEVDRVIIYEAPWIKSTATRDSQPDFEMIERLRLENFDAAIIFTVYSQNPLPAAFLCFMARIPLRLAHCHENSYQLLNHWVPDPEPAKFIRHEVRRQLDLVATVGFTTPDERMSLCPPQPAWEETRIVLTEAGLDLTRPWLIIHAGSTAPSRRYSPEGFAAAARQLANLAGFQVAFTGTGNENEVVENIRSMMQAPSVSLVNRLDLAHMAAAIGLAPVLVSNNTGPAHMAAALGTPVVDLYALTNPQHTPWGAPNRVLNHDVPCKYCYKSICPEGHHNCLRLVKPEQIVQAVLELADLKKSAASAVAEV
jgi:lipopolysaccharide heptosyltransferase II